MCLVNFCFVIDLGSKTALKIVWATVHHLLQYDLVLWMFEIVQDSPGRCVGGVWFV